jgi:hypothetical protein
MASKKTLHMQNPERLAARHLARLLMDISQGDRATKQRLRLELTGA